jgi:diacylglycerol kinase (ATP)
MSKQRFSLRKRLKSFGYAFQGLQQFFISTHNAIIHAAATVVVIVLAVIVHLPLNKFLFVIVAIGLVWMAELFNTAIEKLCDMVYPHEHPQIKFIKDLSAAAVLVTSLMAVIIFLIIFIPVFV